MKEFKDLPDFDLLQEVVNVINEGLLVKDLDGNIVTFNQQALELLGLTAEECKGLNCTALVPSFFKADLTPYLYEEVPSVITMHTGRTMQDIVMGIKSKNGLVWVSINSKIIRIARQNYVLVSLFNISDLVEANKKLSEKEHHLELIVSSIDDIVFEITRDGYMLNCWTNNTENLFYQPEYFIDKKIAEIFPYEVAVPFMQMINKALDESAVQEITYQSPVATHKDKWYKMRISPIRSLEDRVAAVISDITESVKSREQISISERKFHNAFHYSGIGMALVDLDGRCMDVNSKLCKMLGYAPEELRGMTFYEFTHPDDLETDAVKYQELIRHERGYYTIEKRYLHKKGYYIWCLLSTSMVWSSDGTPFFGIAQIQDISAIKTMIGALEQQNAQLELTTLDLEHKISQLEEFNQIVAHNLRSPAGNIQMLISEMEYAPTEHDKQEYFELLKLSSNALIETLQDLIDILEVRLNKSLPFENCNFGQILHKVTSLLSGAIQEKGARIETHFELAEISYPKVYLESILYNLLSNSLKYTHSSRKPHIVLHSYVKDGRHFLSVKDNGLGIDLNRYGAQMFKFKKIFHRGFDSRGVGLFMTRNQIETLGGKIVVESEPGEGTLFTIKF